jgi:hypothetical protein
MNLYWLYDIPTWTLFALSINAPNNPDLDELSVALESVCAGIIGGGVTASELL